MKYKNLKSFLGIILVLFFFLIYFNHSSGTLGGDSDGYFLGAHNLIISGEMSNIENLELNQYLSQNYSKDSINFLVPNRYSLNEDGKLIYRYPPGISYYISFFSIIFYEILGYNFLVCIISSLSLLLFYLFISNYFNKSNKNLLIAFSTTLFLGVLPLYLEYSTAQPMREILIIFFNNLILFFLSKNKFFQNNKYFYWIGLTMILSLYIRYTNIFIFILYLPFLINFFKIENIRIRLLINFFKLILILIILILPLCFFNFENTNSLRPANFDHIQTLKVNNIFDNNGNYQAHIGSLFTYLSQFKLSILPFLIFGVFFLIKSKNYSLILFPLFILILFSMWVNPYPRYILPIIPFVVLFVGIGYKYLLKICKIDSIKIILTVFFILLFLPQLFNVFNNYFLEDKISYKAISFESSNNLKYLSLLNGTILLDNTTSDYQGYLQFIMPNKKIIKNIENDEIYLNYVNNTNLYLISTQSNLNNSIYGLINVNPYVNFYIYQDNLIKDN